MLYLFLFFEVVLGFIAFYYFYLAPKLQPYNRALKFLEEGNIDEAMLELNRAIEKDPENHEAHFKLANIYLKKDALLKAEDHFQKVIDLQKFTEDIQRLDVLRQIAKIQFKQKEYEKSFFTFKEVLSVFSNDYESSYHMGLIYAGQLLYEDAVSYFKQALHARSNDINCRVNAALCLVQDEKPGQAISMLDEAINLAPDNLKIKFYLGIVLFMSQAYKRCVTVLLEVLKKTDENEQKSVCYRLLNGSYYFLKQMVQAYEIIKTGIEFVKLHSMIDEYKTLLFDHIMIALEIVDFETAREMLKVINVLDNYYPSVNELNAYVEFKTKSETVEDEVANFDYSPAVASYFKAAQHVIGMEEEGDSPEDQQEKIYHDIRRSWLESYLEENFLWKLGGLTGSKMFSLEVLSQKAKLENIEGEAKKITSTSFVRDFMKLERKEFQEVGRKVVMKLGYNIIKEDFKPNLADFVEGDGIDFTAREPDNQEYNTLIQIRRWDQGKVGEITFRNMTHAMGLNRARKGIFIVPADLTIGAQKFLEKMPTIRVLTYGELTQLLKNAMS